MNESTAESDRHNLWKPLPYEETLIKKPLSVGMQISMSDINNSEQDRECGPAPRSAPQKLKYQISFRSGQDPVQYELND